MSTFIKAERVVSTTLGLLERKSRLANLVWRDAGGDFRGAKNETITVRLPAYLPARTRALRSGTTRTKDALFERSIAVTLDTDIYKYLGVTDEQMNLDVENFDRQITDPVARGVVDQIESEIATEISGATYEVTIAYVSGTDDPYEDVVVPAGIALDNAHVPDEGRVLLVGTELQADLLRSDKFTDASKSGTTETLRKGVIGDINGFTVVKGGASIAPDAGYAFHSTAYVLSMHIPAVPSSAAWGASKSWNGFAMRMVRGFEIAEVEEQLAADVWVGTNVVKDDGYFDSNGIFIPTTEPGETLGRSLAPVGEADDETFTLNGHGLVAGDEVEFTALTGGTGLATNTTYHVIAAGLTASTFRLSATAGGAAVNFTTDVTASTLRERARPLLIRSVKIAVS
jgi:N4-gp56 family major capsid protein